MEEASNAKTRQRVKKTTYKTMNFTPDVFYKWRALKESLGKKSDSAMASHLMSYFSGKEPHWTTPSSRISPGFTVVQRRPSSHVVMITNVDTQHQIEADYHNTQQQCQNQQQQRGQHHVQQHKGVQTDKEETRQLEDLGEKLNKMLTLMNILTFVIDYYKNLTSEDHSGAAIEECTGAEQSMKMPSLTVAQSTEQSGTTSPCVVMKSILKPHVTRSQHDQQPMKTILPSVDVNSVAALTTMSVQPMIAQPMIAQPMLAQPMPAFDASVKNVSASSITSVQPSQQPVAALDVTMEDASPSTTTSVPSIQQLVTSVPPLATSIPPCVLPKDIKAQSVTSPRPIKPLMATIPPSAVAESVLPPTMSNIKQGEQPASPTLVFVPFHGNSSVPPGKRALPRRAPKLPHSTRISPDVQKRVGTCVMKPVTNKQPSSSLYPSAKTVRELLRERHGKSSTTDGGYTPYKVSSWRNYPKRVTQQNSGIESLLFQQSHHPKRVTKQNSRLASFLFQQSHQRSEQMADRASKADSCTTSLEFTDTEPDNELETGHEGIDFEGCDAPCGSSADVKTEKLAQLGENIDFGDFDEFVSGSEFDDSSCDSLEDDEGNDPDFDPSSQTELKADQLVGTQDAPNVSPAFQITSDDPTSVLEELDRKMSSQHGVSGDKMFTLDDGKSSCVSIKFKPYLEVVHLSDGGAGNQSDNVEGACAQSEENLLESKLSSRTEPSSSTRNGSRCVYRCTVCKKESASLQSIKKHIGFIEIDGGREYVECSHCARLIHKLFIKRHEKRHLNGSIENKLKKQFCCTYSGCSYKCSRRKGIEQHVKAVHENHRNHQCTWEGCGKRFNAPHSLEVHMRIHSGDKPIVCYMCGYRCRQKASLNWHMKTKHP